MTCLSILWNSVSDYKEEIVEGISQITTIHDAVDLELGEDYESFVRDIYDQDKIPTSRINQKLEAMACYPGKTCVTVILFETDNETMAFNERKGRYLCTFTENLKAAIREKYSKLIPLYVYDNVIHMTHDEEEALKDVAVVNKYLEKKSEKPRKLMKRKIKPEEKA